MSQDLPAPPSPHAATADAEDSLAMLLGALAGEDLPDDLRTLLQQAADALQVAASSSATATAASPMPTPPRSACSTSSPA